MLVVVTATVAWASVFRIVPAPPGRLATVMLAVSSMHGSGSMTKDRIPSQYATRWIGCRRPSRLDGNPRATIPQERLAPAPPAGQNLRHAAATTRLQRQV